MAAYSPFPSVVSQLNALPKAKKVFPRLGEVPSQVLQQAIKQLHRSSGGICWKLGMDSSDLKRGIELISTAGHAGIQNAYADGLPGTDISV